MTISKDPSMLELLKYTVAAKASDLHLGAGVCPAIRVDGDLKYISDIPTSSERMVGLIREHLQDDRLREFERERELDYSFGVAGLGRFRVNLFFQRGSIGCALRVLPFDPMTFEEMGFPLDTANYLTTKPSGLILVTGPTGSGKTTTLAAMIDAINTREAFHIVTVEDPIEVVFKNKKSMINQRELGSDTKSFSQSLKHVLRQDPDVILIGEMRDLETIEIALTVAETGHLVFATLHTPDAVQSINRVIDVFPAHQQQQVRVQLSFVLQAVSPNSFYPRKTGG
ncbi:MAG: PilT/PilU family type 4a pilus ATPase [Candidatus Omnitrophota bacterium]